MAAKFNREDVQLGAIPVGMYPTDTTTTPAPLALPNRALDWGVLPSGSSGQVLTVNANGSIGWAAGGGGLTVGTTTIASGTNNAVLYGNSTDVVSQSSNLTFDGTNLAIASSGQIKMGADGFFEESGARQLTLGSTSSTALCDVLLACNTTTTFILRLEGRGGANDFTNIGPELQIGGAAGNAVFIVGGQQSMMRSVAVGTTPLLVLGKASQTAPLQALQQISSTSTARTCGYVDATFNSSTDATWTGNLFLYAGDYTSSNAGKRLGFQVQSNGSAALVGLFGATPVVKPVGGGNDVTNFTAVGGTAATSTSTWTGATGASTYTVGDIVTALKALGILTA